MNSSSVEITSSVLTKFDVLDYSMFAIMLGFSAMIGVYFGMFARRDNTTTEYLMGGKNMGMFPVSMSLISSYISGITLLGMPAEIYVYGTQYWATAIAIILMTVGCGVFFLPVFYRLQVNTSYEYLQIRFDRRVRLLGSALFIISTLIYVPFVIYIPALAFSQVTGVNLHWITPIVCLVCIFYTTLGGLKAVVWADSLQTIIMFGSMIVVISVGTYSVGGLDVIWERSEQSGRIEFFNLSLDPTHRHTFWNISFGTFFGWLTSTSIGQDMVQRFLSMPSLKKAQGVLLIFSVGVSILISLSCYAGLLIYATYYDCDLVSTKIVHASDQVFPYFVMDVVGFIPGLPGLFMAGVFSAALSSMSTGLNSMSGVMYQDFIQPNLSNVSEARANIIIKIICVVLGMFCVLVVFAIENLGGVIQVYHSLGGITTGPTLGIFVLGMFFPWSNAIGTLVGGISGLFVMGWISFGTQAAISASQITFPHKPVSVEGCEHYIPLNITEEIFDNIEEPLAIFRLSYTLYTLTGFLVVVVIGLVVSFITGPQNSETLNPDLLTPFVRNIYIKRRSRYQGKPEEQPAQLVSLLQKNI